MATAETKASINWRGVMVGDSARLRPTVFGALVAVCLALTVTQLGFFEAPIPGEGGTSSTVRIVVLLLPIALGALLFGVLRGALLGLLTGVILFVHARVMPLDIYEMSFVDESTVVLFAFVGLLLGFLFAIALRNNPTTIRRFVYIAIICVFVSWLYSSAFSLNVLDSLIREIQSGMRGLALTANDDIQALVVQAAAATVLRMGSVGMQAWIDAAAMTAICCLGDVTLRRFVQWREDAGMHAVFNLLLSEVVLVAFMIMAAVSFVFVTSAETQAAFTTMKSEVDYLCNQLDSADERFAALSEVMESPGMDYEVVNQERWQRLMNSIQTDSLLDGYTEELDGIVVISYNNIVGLTNYSEYSDAMSIALNGEVIRAMRESQKSGEPTQFVYYGSILKPPDTGEAPSAEMLDAYSRARFDGAEIAYLYSEVQGTDGSAGSAGTDVSIIWPSHLVYEDRQGAMVTTTVVVLILLLAVIGVVSFLLNRMVLRRIDETNGVLGRITGGDLDARVEVHDSREFNSLSDGINATVDAMKGWIAEAETRMDAELETARAIQESALPRTFPPFPDILRFDVHASMAPARQVGGDFYDFFLIGEDSGPDAGRLGFVVADVSGKGVPAALFMMEAKSQIRGYVSSGMELGEAVENANRQLCDGNDAGMFVTAWVGVLDYATGRVDYVNAGHNPPLLWSFAGDDEAPAGSWRWLTERSGLPLGLFDGLPYTAHALECLPGDQLLMYSDGVTEAMDPDGNLYGEERLMALAQRTVGAHPRELVTAVKREVAEHAAGAEQSDDITVLSLEVGVPPEVTASISVPALISELPRINEFIHAELERRLCPSRVQNLIDVAVEELFVNVCSYAYPDAAEGNPGIARVGYTYSAEPPCIEIDIVDEGIPYNPLAKPDAVTPDDIMDVPIGGLGILMAKRSVDEMRYERSGKTNVVTIVKRW